MNEQQNAFENIVREARLARTLAVKAAKADLNAAIRAAYGALRRQLACSPQSGGETVHRASVAGAIDDAIELAWKTYNSRLMGIWELYGTAIQKAQDGLRKSRPSEPVSQAPRDISPVPLRNRKPATAAITTSIFDGATVRSPAGEMVLLRAGKGVC